MARLALVVRACHSINRLAEALGWVSVHEHLTSCSPPLSCCVHIEPSADSRNEVWPCWNYSSDEFLRNSRDVHQGSIDTKLATQSLTQRDN